MFLKFCKNIYLYLIQNICILCTLKLNLVLNVDRMFFFKLFDVYSHTSYVITQIYFVCIINAIQLRWIFRLENISAPLGSQITFECYNYETKNKSNGQLFICVNELSCRVYYYLNEPSTVNNRQMNWKNSHIPFAIFLWHVVYLSMWPKEW